MTADEALGGEAPAGELPGSELVARGLVELAAGQPLEAGLLVLIAAPRLRGLGVVVPTPLGRDGDGFPEDALYARLCARLGDGAHSEFNALRRRIVRYAEALEQRLARNRTRQGGALR